MLQDGSVLIQRGALQPKLSLEEQSAGPGNDPAFPTSDTLKTITGIVKALTQATSAAKSGKQAAAPPPKPIKQTEEEKAREPATREGLRRDINWLLKELTVPALMRGSITSFLVPEMMSQRKLLGGNERLLFDNLLAIDFTGVNIASMLNKSEEIAAAFSTAGFNDQAVFIEFWQPLLKAAKYSNGNLPAGVSNLQVLSTLAREMAAVKGLDRSLDSRQLLNELSMLYQHNEGRNKSAMQLIKELKITNPAPFTPLAADLVFHGLGMLNVSQPEFVARDCAHYLRTANITLPPINGQAQTHGAKPYADFWDDVAELMERNEFVPAKVMPRVATLWNQLEVVHRDDLVLFHTNFEKAAQGVTDLINNVQHTWSSFVSDGVKPLVCNLDGADKALSICSDVTLAKVSKSS